MVEENLNLIGQELNLLSNLIKNLPASKNSELLFDYLKEQYRILKKIRHQIFVIGKPYHSNISGSIVRFVDGRISGNDDYDEFMKILEPGLLRISCLERNLRENNNIP